MQPALAVLGAGTGAVVVLLLVASAVLGGLMAGFFFAYSVSVVLALDRLPALEYTTVMQDINETVINAVFGVVFFGAVIVPALGAGVVVLDGDWTSLYGQLFLAGVSVYLFGAFFVTMFVHIPMNDDIETWSRASPPENWAAVRDRWRRWNHVRTTAAVLAFVLYLAAIAAYST